jgi:hypothetical protein
VSREGRRDGRWGREGGAGGLRVHVGGGRLSSKGGGDVGDWLLSEGSHVGGGRMGSREQQIGVVVPGRALGGGESKGVRWGDNRSSSAQRVSLWERAAGGC